MLALELGRVEDRAAAGRARQRAAGCREGVDVAELPVLVVVLHAVGLRRAREGRALSQRLKEYTVVGAVAWHALQALWPSG
eukprot:7377789-Prymnesium_polylepis.1